MTHLENTIAQLSGPAAAVGRNALGGAIALAMPVIGFFAGEKLAGKNGVVAGTVLGLILAGVIMTKITASTVSEI